MTSIKRQELERFQRWCSPNKTCEPRKSASQRRTTTPSHAKPACDGDPGSVLRLYAIVRTIWDRLSLEQLEPYSLVEYGVYLFPPPVRAASAAMLTGPG